MKNFKILFRQFKMSLELQTPDTPYKKSRYIEIFFDEYKKHFFGKKKKTIFFRLCIFINDKVYYEEKYFLRGWDEFRVFSFRFLSLRILNEKFQDNFPRFKTS